MLLKDKTILILSPESWGAHFVSKHHYASELAEHNTVFFSGPPSFCWPSKKQIQPQLYEICYPRIPGLNRLPRRARTVLQWMQCRIVESLVGKKLDVVWSFDPFVIQNLKLWRTKYSIYHGVDLHSCPLEEECVASADLALFSSDLLAAKFSHVPTPCYQMNHGLSRHFLYHLPGTCNQSRRNGPRRLRVGLVGNLHYEFLDYEILFRIVDAHPEVDFVFVGPKRRSNLGRATRVAEIRLLEGRSNTRLAGTVPPKELPGLYDEFDMFLMCYSGDRHRTELANPHKILEFLSSGKVTVCHYVDQYRNRRDLVEMVDRTADLPARFAEVVRDLGRYNAPEIMEQRRNFARMNSYARHIEKVASLLAEVGRKKETAVSG